MCSFEETEILHALLEDRQAEAERLLAAMDPEYLEAFAETLHNLLNLTEAAYTEHPDAPVPSPLTGGRHRQERYERK